MAIEKHLFVYPPETASFFQPSYPPKVNVDTMMAATCTKLYVHSGVNLYECSVIVLVDRSDNGVRCAMTNTAE